MQCNKCWHKIEGQAYITSCSHVFCVRDGDALFAKGTTCVCGETFTQRSDVQLVHTTISEESKATMLYGLSPDEVTDIALRAIKFYQYQEMNAAEYRRFQERHAADKLHKREKQLRDQLVETQNAANTLANQVRELQEAMTQKERMLKELGEKYSETTRQKRKLQELYSAHVLAKRVGGSLGDSAGAAPTGGASPLSSAFADLGSGAPPAGSPHTRRGFLESPRTSGSLSGTLLPQPTGVATRMPAAAAGGSYGQGPFPSSPALSAPQRTMPSQPPASHSTALTMRTPQLPLFARPTAGTPAVGTPMNSFMRGGGLVPPFRSPLPAGRLPAGTPPPFYLGRASEGTASSGSGSTRASVFPR